MKARIFLQSELLKDVEVLELPGTAGSDGLRKACLARLPEEVDKSTLHLFIEDEDEDGELPTKLPDGLRVHLHRLKGIDVTVRYAGRDVRRTFRPSTTVGRVKRWASRDLGISASDGAELMLQICGTDNRPDADIHVGTLVHFPERSLCLDLVPSPRING